MGNEKNWVKCFGNEENNREIDKYVHDKLSGIIDKPDKIKFRFTDNDMQNNILMTVEVPEEFNRVNNKRPNNLVMTKISFKSYTGEEENYIYQYSDNSEKKHIKVELKPGKSIAKNIPLPGSPKNIEVYMKLKADPHR